MSTLKARNFVCRREKDTLRLVQSLHTTLKFAEADMPFELSVLESLLSETVQHFERHHKRILLLSDSVEREIGEVLKTSAGDLTRLLPIQKYAHHIFLVLQCPIFSVIQES